MNEFDGLIHRVIQSKGNEHQMIIAIEEMAELTKELTKSLRHRDNRDAVLEEYADVTICLMQIREIFALKDIEIQSMVNKKLDRLRERLDAEQ